MKKYRLAITLENGDNSMSVVARLDDDDFRGGRKEKIEKDILKAINKIRCMKIKKLKK